MPTTTRRQPGISPGPLPIDQVVWSSPDRLSGAPCFTRTRVPIKALFDYLEGGETLYRFVDDFLGVQREQALSAIYYGKERLIPAGVPQPTGLALGVPPHSPA
jgi:uncharacterized protein (DUF433 family)